MKKVAAFLFLIANLSHAADVHFTWLLSASNVAGLPQQTEVTQYGAQVLISSENPKVTEFQVSVFVELANGDLGTYGGTVTRDLKSPNVLYSTTYVAWVGPDPNFRVLAIQVKAVSTKSVQKPFPGRDYSSDAPVGNI
jgi:hypothetical protein